MDGHVREASRSLLAMVGPAELMHGGLTCSEALVGSSSFLSTP